MVLGVRGINLGGADGDLKEFFIRVGYHGRHSMMSKGLPECGRFQQARRRKLLTAASASSSYRRQSSQRAASWEAAQTPWPGFLAAVRRL